MYRSQSFLPRCVAAVAVSLSLLLARAADVTGYVTRAGTPERFFVNEKEVHCIPGKTQLRTLIEDIDPRDEVVCRQWVVGEEVVVHGPANKGIIVAKRVDVQKHGVVKVDGFALVDRVLSPVVPDIGMVRADGYQIAITPKTKLSFTGDLSRRPATNEWVHYAGTLRPDGTVEAHSLAFRPNEVNRTEDDLRAKTEFDAAAVKEDDRQGRASKFFLGRNDKKIPAWDDPAMQARITAIGEKLIPRFQRELQDSDPTKIHFRFQLVDEKSIPDGISLPSGIILVPYQVLVALPSDTEVAAVLASDIAEVMEEQVVRLAPGKTALSTTSLAATGVGLFVPFVGLTTIGPGAAEHVREVHMQQQSTRAALALMDDAGYDIREAPLAWWRLADWREIPLSEVKLPERTQYAYQVLSTAWRGKQYPASQ